MEVQDSPVPCGVQQYQAREDRNLRIPFTATCHLTGWGPAGIFPLWSCQQASCSILNLLLPVFPWLSVHVVAAVLCLGNSPPLLWITFPLWRWCLHGSNMVPLMAANFIYYNIPYMIQILNLGLLRFSAYHCRASLPCAILLFEMLPLVASLQPYSRHSLPSEAAFLKVSDVPFNLGRHKWEERILS